MLTITTHSAQETAACGKRLASALTMNDVVLLEGDLGGGKTTFVQGLMKGLGYTRHVLSPTFTLARHYKTKKMTVYHLDLYRLVPSDIQNSEFDEYFYPKDAITLIEWGERAEELVDSFIKIKFIFISESKRKLIFSEVPKKPRLEKIVRSV